MMVDILTEFYKVHYNFALIAAFMLLFALYIGSRKNVRGVVVMLCLLLVYNLIIFNKTKRDPDWYDKLEAKIKAFDPVKAAWDNKVEDDDPNKHK
ncbi:MAG: hypothetical protein LBC75_11070 [Fibromonadaceae bacterium]|jgi:hypothetical protein|nr:hypothetical protein [Fibromonadaceae bacterium]